MGFLDFFKILLYPAVAQPWPTRGHKQAGNNDADDELSSFYISCLHTNV